MSQRIGVSGKQRTIKIKGYHIIFWALAYLFWVFVFRNNTLAFTRTATIQFCYLIFIAGNYYLNTLLTIPLLLKNGKYFLFVLCFLSSIAITALLRVPVFIFVNRFIFRAAATNFDHSQIFIDSFINIFFWTLSVLGASFLFDNLRTQKYIEQIEREKAENELNFLRAQFNPHFLFNSINSIYAHIDKSNKRAREMLLIFSEMLRYQLYECNVEKIELDREINYIRNYVALQKSRMDQRIAVSFYTAGVGGHVQVAPLLLMAFIENAFKYVGFNEWRENRIDITLHYENGAFSCKIFNTTDHAERRPENASGLGITNAKRRLELLYPGKHALLTDEKKYSYSTSLILYGV